MRISVQDASAKVYDVEAPDDAPLDKVVASATKSLGREVRVVDPPTKGQYAYSKAAKGFGEGPGMVGVPFDFGMGLLRGGNELVKQQIRKARGEKYEREPAFRSTTQDTIKRGWAGLLDQREVPAPSTASEWFIGKPAEFLGASAIPSTATVAKASRPVLAGVTELFSNYFGGVGAKAGEEGGEAVGKGVAKVVGADKEAQEKAGQVGRVVGGVGGGLGLGGGTAMAAPRVGGTVIDWTRKALIPKLKDQGEIEKVAESLFTKHFRESLISDPRYKPNLEQALATREAIPGFDPDLSMAAGTPAVRSLQTHAETQSPAAAAHGVAKREGAVKALGEYRDANFPQGEKTLQELSTTELNVAERQLAADQAVIETKQAGLKEKVRSGVFGPEEGQELEALKRAEYKAALARSDAQYTEVYKLADRIGYQGALDTVVDYINRYKRDLNRVAQATPAVINDLLQSVKRAALETKRAAMKQLYPDAERMPDGIVAGVARQGGLSKIDLGGDLPDIGKTPTWAQRGKEYSFYLVHNGPTAKSADEMLLRLKQDGYLPENASINDMIAAIEDELSAGQATYFKASDWETAAKIQQQKAYEKMEEFGVMTPGERESIRNRMQELEAAGDAEGVARLQAQLKSRPLSQTQGEGGELGVEFAGDAKYPAGFGPMHSILKRIRQEKRYYASKSNDEARLAMKPLNDLEALVTERIGTAGEEVGSKLAQADALYKANVSEPFYNGVAAQAFNDRGLIENVARRMVSKGEEGAKNFKQVYGESERAQDLLWNGVIDALAERIGAREVNSKIIQAYYEAHKKFLDQFPTIRRNLATVEKVAKGLEDRLVTIAEQRRAVNSDLISTLVGRPDPEKYLVSIVQNEAAMRNVASWAKKNPEMGQQIVRAYVDGLMEKADPAALLLANEKTLKPVFEAVAPGHWKKVMTLLTGESIRRRGAGDPLFKPEVVTDPLRVLTGTGTSGLFSRIRGAVYRQISPEYVLVDVGGKYFFRIQQEQAREAINAALYDPKLIDNILALDHQLSLPKPPWEKIKQTLGEMKQHYANHAIRVGVVESESSNEEPATRRSREAGERAMRGAWR